MARGRFISKAISLDEKVNALSSDSVRLLFTWLIAHLDCEGRMYGDPQTVKSIVFPQRSMDVRTMQKYLDELVESTLIQRYVNGGTTYIYFPNFKKHQIGLNKTKESPSQIPPFTPELIQNNDGLCPLQVKVKDKVQVKVKEEDKVTPLNPPVSSISPEKKELLKDTTLKDAIEVFRENIFEPTEDIEKEIEIAINIFSAVWVIDAIKLATSRGKKSWPYIGGILQNWKRWGRVVKIPGQTTRRQYKPKGYYNDILKFHQERAMQNKARSEAIEGQ